MRNNLDLIEKIDNYLLGKLSNDEQKQFETEINADPELKTTIENQKLVLQAIHRKGIRTDIKNASTPTTGFWGWIIGIVVVTVIIITLYFSSIHNNLLRTEKNVPHIEYSLNGLKTLVEPDVQQFSINVEQGATIEGKNGTVVFIPTDAFVDNQGNIISGKIDFELVEALSLSDMVLYNLTTTADGQTLETGGMIYTNALYKNEKVAINPERPLYIEIPTTQKKEGMLVFTGETTPEGNLNWKDPKPLKKYLALIDFKNLDFLPRGFEDKIKEENINSPYYAETKEKIDSLYYTLSYHRIVNENLPRKNVQIDSLIYLCGLEPKTVKNIQTAEFKQTFIATKAFEQRIHELHKLEYARDYLNLYIHNLEKPLWEVDNIVAQQLSGTAKTIFTNFANQKLTNVKDLLIHQKQLSAYYNKSINERNKTTSKLKVELSNMTDEELTAVEQQDTRPINVIPQTVATTNVYSFRTFQTGWANIDRYMKFLDEDSKVVHFITEGQSPELKIYQWLNAINTLTPIRINNGKAFTAFPSKDQAAAQQMKSTYTIAVSNTLDGCKWAMVNYNPYLHDSIKIELTPIKLNQLIIKLKELEGSSQALLKDATKSKELLIEEKKKREERIRIKKEAEKEAQQIAAAAQQERIKKEKAYQQKRLRSKPRREFELRVAPVTFPCEVTELKDIDVIMVDSQEFKNIEMEIENIYEEFE